MSCAAEGAEPNFWAVIGLEGDNKGSLRFLLTSVALIVMYMIVEAIAVMSMRSFVEVMHGLWSALKSVVWMISTLCTLIYMLVCFVGKTFAEYVLLYRENKNRRIKR